MGQYNGNAAAVHDLVRETEVHRDVYIDQEMFELEMEHLFANTWIYVGHDSQVPNAGDYYGTTIGTQPVLMVRHTDGAVHVLYNRCPHKGTRITTETCGNAGKFFRCPYHAWIFQDRRLAARDPAAQGLREHRPGGEPRRQGHDPGPPCEQLSRLRLRQAERRGPDFEEYLRRKPVDASTTWSIVRRPGGWKSPAACCATCTIAIGKCWSRTRPTPATRWSRTKSSAGTAVEVWKKMLPGSNKKPLAVEIYAPFMAPYEFFENMGIRVWRNGHGHTGVHHSIHSDYSAIPGYFDKMVAAYGEERAKAILDENRHNTSISRTSWSRGRSSRSACSSRSRQPDAGRILDVPSGRRAGQLLERTLMYNRLINAPTSIVGHDDLEMYERAQEGLHVDANPWVNIQRLYDPAEAEQETAVMNGTSEWQMRNQFRAWSKFMTMSM